MKKILLNNICILRKVYQELYENNCWGIIKDCKKIVYLYEKDEDKADAIWEFLNKDIFMNEFIAVMNKK